MAQMFPPIPDEEEFPYNNGEKEIYEALKKLDKDYMVFHSFRLLNIDERNALHESEEDFVIFHPNKGLLCIEAKAGSPYCENGVWHYQDHTIMEHNGPYNQADSFKWKIEKKFEKMNMKEVWERCYAIHAVWFPHVLRSGLSQISFPVDGLKEITLTQDDLSDPRNRIDSLFEMELPRIYKSDYKKHTLSENDVKKIVENVLCPTFHLIQTKESIKNQRNVAFSRMLREQEVILDFLEEQPFAVINGVAGTGKTLIAKKKAIDHAINNEHVLFLCYNNKLKEYLQKECKDFADYIHIYTLDGFSTKVCGSINYDELFKCLEKMHYEDMDYTVPFKHVIIDEGQDFGRNCDRVIEELEEMVLEDTVNGSFYLFYDKNQFVQGDVIPQFIQDADCKLTLYRNCRNTKNIAKTSTRSLNSDLKVRCKPGTYEGDLPMFCFTEKGNESKAVERLIDDFRSVGTEEIVLLTCKTEEKTCLYDLLENENNEYCFRYKNKSYPLCSCRRFKGLEADGVILLDVDSRTFTKEKPESTLEEDRGGKLFYVGASRARYNLGIVSSMDEDECKSVIEMFGEEYKRNPKKDLATILGSSFCNMQNK